MVFTNGFDHVFRCLVSKKALFLVVYFLKDVFFKG